MIILSLETLFLSIAPLICLFSIAIYLNLRRKHQYWEKLNITGPTPHSIAAGSFPKTVDNRLNLVQELHEVYLKYKDNHKFVGVYSGTKPVIFVLDPNLATDILKKNFSSFHDNDSSNWTSFRVEHLRPYSPFVSRGEEWKTLRSELVSVLAMSRLRQFFPILCENAAKLTSYLESHSDTEFIDAKELASRFTANFISNYIWGVEANAFRDNSICTIQQMAQSMLSQTLNCVRYYYGTISFPILRRLRPVRFFPKHTDAFFLNLAKNILKSRSINPEVRNDVMDHLIQLRSKKPISDMHMAGHTTTLLIDGFETAALVISHFLLLLSRNPRVQAKLREELCSFEQQKLTLEQLFEFPYLDQCFQETLRLFPPLPTLFKLCTKPITLSNCDSKSSVNLHPDDVVYISSYSFHRDGDFYENPEAFWPERFDAELGGVRKFQNMGVFLPFGDGPRICLGMKLGVAETKTAVAEIVKNFQIECSPCTRKDNKIAVKSSLLRLDGDIKLRFKRLGNAF